MSKVRLVSPSIEDVLASTRPAIKAVIEKWIPRKFDTGSLSRVCEDTGYEHDPESLTAGLCVPIYDMLDRGGKGWRGALLLLIVESLGGNPDDALDLSCISEVVHNGTLAIDDIEDGSTHRRGKPCMHLKFGVDVAINAGNAMYFLPLLALKEKRNKLSDAVLLKCYECYAQQMINVHMGQAIDIWWHNSKKDADPTVGQYLQMCAFKTGALAKMSALMGAYISGASDEVALAIGKFTECIGVAFQIQDDILNIVGEQFSEGKGGVGEDIREGKRTLMILHCLETGGEPAKRLRAIVEAHTDKDEEIKEAIDILKKSGSVEYASNYARDMVATAWKDIQGYLHDGKAKDSLKSFADYLISRSV